MHYRDATIDDINNIAKLHAQSWRDSYRGIFPAHFLDHDVWDERNKVWTERLSSPKNNQRIIVATDNEKICAFICAFGDAHGEWGSYIDNLHVAKPFQDRGIAKQLLLKIALWSQQYYLSPGIYLEVVEDNLNARAFYQSIGAKHQLTKLWSPPGSDTEVNDMVYAWDSNVSLSERIKCG